MLKPVQVGNSGLMVSQLCLGTMNFGVPGQGHQGDWTLDLDRSREIFRTAIDHGLFYFDCADFYGIGASEQVVDMLSVNSLRAGGRVSNTSALVGSRRSPSQNIVKVLSVDALVTGSLRARRIGIGGLVASVLSMGGLVVSDCLGSRAWDLGDLFGCAF